MESIELAREWGFGTLAVASSDAAPMMSHIPFLISPDGSFAELHLVRSNPITRAINTATPARIAVMGPHGYISPDWYGIENQVPTWNYVAFHLTGRLVPLPATDLPGILVRLSNHFEEQLTPKPVWSMDKIEPDTQEKLMRQIAPFRFEIDEFGYGQ